MRYLLLSFILLLVTQFSAAQQTDSTFMKPLKGLSEIDFIIAKSAYLKMSQSDDYINQRKALQQLAKKIPRFENQAQIIQDDMLFEKWITENLNLTKFKTIEEGIALRKLAFDLGKKMMDENPEIHELMPRASLTQLKEILKPHNATQSEIDEMRE